MSLTDKLQIKMFVTVRNFPILNIQYISNMLLTIANSDRAAMTPTKTRTLVFGIVNVSVMIRRKIPEPFLKLTASAPVKQEKDIIRVLLSFHVFIKPCLRMSYTLVFFA